MKLVDTYRKAVDELRDESVHTPKPRSQSPKRRGGLISWSQNDAFSSHEPPRDAMQEYWRAYETVPFIRQSISSFAREVVEPGWYIETEDEEAAKEIAEWFRNCAIVERQAGKDFTLLLKKAVIQREVRGTALAEHVPDQNNDEQLAGLKLINPETVTTFTNDDTSLLWQPDETDVPEKVPKTEDGSPAAYVQFYESAAGKDEVPFTADEITQLTRDADVGEVYGTSRLESVLDRIESLRRKLHDQDKAIKNKAWPVWVFGFGEADDPWHPDDIDAFMEEEDEDNFSPGTKHGVQGDISVQTVGGDVPDISASIKYDIDHILSNMPMPKFATGFADDINQHTAKQQERHVMRQVREARREVEYEFQPVVEQIAEQLGHGDLDDLRLRIEYPEGEDPEEWIERGSTIRYVSTVDEEDGEGDGADAGASDPDSDGGDGGDSQSPDESPDGTADETDD